MDWLRKMERGKNGKCSDYKPRSRVSSSGK
jgi:hypothetical protein